MFLSSVSATQRSVTQINGVLNKLIIQGSTSAPLFTVEKSMKIVTLAHITLNRPGSLSRGGFRSDVSDGSPRDRSATVIVASEKPDDVLEAVKKLAIEHGEQEERLAVLGVSTPYGKPRGTIYFKESQMSYNGTRYGSDYAVCDVFPALEVDGRYFRLDEVVV
jgi:hypothetical protein